MRIQVNSTAENVGFQIAPMIDVVFVIMLFFMVMAGAVKIENELNTQLPGTAATSTSTDFVDEQIITISDIGEVSLNDEPFDTPQSKELPQLRGTLMRLKQNADAPRRPRWSRSSATSRRSTAAPSMCSTLSPSRRSTT
jgi:biopolymer transport protein ExbD